MLKTKRDPNKPAGRTRFIIIWTLGMLLAQVVSSLLTVALTRTIGILDIINMFLVTSSLMLPISAFIQVQLVERLLKRSMRGWSLYTITGLVTTFVLYFMLQIIPRLEESLRNGFDGTVGFGFYSLMLLSTLLSGLPALAFQTFWLRRQAKNTWLWLIVGVSLMMVSAGSHIATIKFGINAPNQRFIGQILLSLLYAVVPGLAMYHMMMHSGDEEKAKIEATEDEVITQERVQRLKESEATPQSWINENQQQKRSVL